MTNEREPTLKRLLEYLQEPELINCEVNELGRFAAHQAVLNRKAMIRDVFKEFHLLFSQLDRQWFSGKGIVIELGAGIYPVRETYPEVLATDVVPAAHLDRVLNACDMAIDGQSVRAFYLQNVFHHLPSPAKFFSELNRVLVPGGGAILIEPAASPFASWIYPKLFTSEDYDRNAVIWDTPVNGPMRGANQALSYLVFDRDIDEFHRANPELEVVHREVLGNWLRYLLSGGLNFRSLVPGWSAKGIKAMEHMLGPVRKHLALHRVIVIRKRAV